MTSILDRPSAHGSAGQPDVIPDPMLEQYARQLRRELELVERKLRGEVAGSVPPESHVG